MNFEEILAPVDEYRKRYKDEFAENARQEYENLVAQSAVDEAANGKTVAKIRALEKVINKFSEYLNALKGGRTFLVLIAIFSTAVAGVYILQQFDMLQGVYKVSRKQGAVALGFSPVSIYLIFGVLNEFIEKTAKSLDAKRKLFDALMKEAWAQMAPLNRLFQWDTVAKVIMKTIPLVQIDKFLSASRMNQLIQHYHWQNPYYKNRSVLCCQSGTINGNPWLIFEALIQQWGYASYSGSLQVTYEVKERRLDSDGNYRTYYVTKTETLTATLEKPVPSYHRKKFLLYGNDAAPDLCFSREPNSLSQGSDGFWGKLRLRWKIRRLQRKSRSVKTDYTLTDNSEFDACFNALDRNNEQQFRLLFTVLAQEQMLKILRDTKCGYGDDFSFEKKKGLNVLTSSHLNNNDVSCSPATFRNYELAASRKSFNEYSNNFFRVFYFSLAPIFAIPLYQQYRSEPDGTGEQAAGAASLFEYETLANDYGQKAFAPVDAATQCILKSQVVEQNGTSAKVAVTANSYKAVPRRDYVSVRAENGHYYDVPVDWIEYLPTSHTSFLAAKTTRAADSNERQEENASADWQNFFSRYDVGEKNICSRRNLISFFTQK